ncbi:MAG: hypothetical protein U0667_11530 [Chloroflexota bacterium]
MPFRGLEWQDDFPGDARLRGLVGAAHDAHPVVVSARVAAALSPGLTAALILLPDYPMHGNPGFAQLGWSLHRGRAFVLWLMLGSPSGSG